MIITFYGPSKANYIVFYRPYIVLDHWLRQRSSKFQALSYTCQLSRIMRESHTCGSKTSISRIEDNFSRLTHKSRGLVLFKTH